MKVHSRPKKRARIEIIPMIDVIFFLLVFFMVSSLAMTKINSLAVALPKTSVSPTASKQNVVLTINSAGALFVNKIPVTLDSLGQALVSVMSESPEDPVLVNADEAVNYGLVVQALDRARKIGVRRFSLATESGDAKR